MTNLRIPFSLILLLWLLPLQPVSSQTPPAHAIINSTIHHADGSETESGSIVWRDGIIASIGRADSIEIPFDARIIDGGDSLHVYPGLVDGLALWGSPERSGPPERVDNPGEPGYERAGIQPDRLPSKLIQSSDEVFSNALKQGYTTALIGLEGYMLPGQTEIFFLHDNDTKSQIYREKIGFLFQFEPAPGGWGNRAYPTTTMGVMARFRQLLYDAEALMQHLDYYSESEPGMPVPQRDEVLEALFPILNQEKEIFFAADSKEDIERYLRLHDEFDLNSVIVSGGEAYRVSEELLERDIPVLASFNLPDPPEWYSTLREEGESEVPEVSGPEEERYRKRQLNSWLDRVKNIRSLLDAGVHVGFASNGLSLDDIQEKTNFLLDEGEITAGELLTIMTSSTSSILGISTHTGALREGMIANFSLWTNPTNEEEARILKTVSNGTIIQF
ncbi:MAG: amidohydrolase family protein [Balneolaceae bacterium]